MTNMMTSRVISDAAFQCEMQRSMKSFFSADFGGFNCPAAAVWNAVRTHPDW
jgi:hypothetical protein